MAARAFEHSPALATDASADVPRDRWLTGLDGLRAIAVLAVLGFHAGFSSVTGGFLGVDVFFVISGYLITALLLREFDARGRIDVRAFWFRRARRLLPALFLLLAGVVLFAIAVLPSEVARLRGDVLAALAYVTNWYLILDQQSYFEAIGRPSMLRHLWSLAVEEQFYLLWPLLLGAALLLVRRWGALALTVGLAAASAIWMAVLFDPNADPSRLYYGTDTRLSGLLVGAALAFVWVPGVRMGVALPGSRAVSGPGAWAAAAGRGLRRWGPDVIAVLGLTGLVWAFATVDLYGATLYQGGFLLIAIVTAAVIAAVVYPSSVIGRRVLDSPVPRWIGQRSYSIYLWHWPIFAVTRPGIDVGLDFWPVLGLRLVATFGLAAASYRFVELPVRRGALTRLWRDWQRARSPQFGRLRLAMSTSATLVAVAVLLVAGQVAAARPAPSPDYIPEALQAIVGALPGPSGDPGTAVAGVSGGPASSGDPATDPAATDDQGGGVIYTDQDPDPSADPSAGSAAQPSGDPGATAAPTAGAVAGATAAPASRRTARPTARATAGPPAHSTPRPTDTPEPSSVTSGALASAIPTVQPTPVGPPAKVYAIGDSVMLGAARQLGKALGRVEVDAAISRQTSTVVSILQDRRSAGRLPDIVIIHTGTNGPVTPGQLQNLMAAVSRVDHVVLINDRVPDDWEAHNNRMFAQIAEANPRVLFIDWHAATEGRSDLFWNDGTHMRPEGATFYANLIAETLRTAGVSTR